MVENEIINLKIEQLKGTIAICYVEILGEVHGQKLMKIMMLKLKSLKVFVQHAVKFKQDIMKQLYNLERIIEK